MGIPGDLTAAVEAADTHEKSDPSPLDFDILSIWDKNYNKGEGSGYADN